MGFRRGLLRDYDLLLSGVVRILDVALLIGFGLLCYGLRFGEPPHRVPQDYLILILTSALMLVVLFPLFGLYRSWRGFSLLNMLGRIITAWAALFIAVTVLLWALKLSEEYSRLWMGFWALSSLSGLAGVRIGVHAFLRQMRRRGWNRRYVAICGAGRLGREMLSRVQSATWTGYDVVRFFDDDTGLIGSEVNGVPVSSLDEAGVFARQRNLDEIWIALPLRAEDRVKEVMDDLGDAFVRIRFVPDIFGFRLLNHAPSEIAGMPVIDLTSSPMEGLNLLVKSIEDRVLALLILVLVSPVMLAVALMIKLTSTGPVLFKQHRHGWDGRPIRVYKFRTMVQHSEASGVVTQAKRDDPRVTPIGRFLRRTSLDELPQFFNVLQGKMSIVGPRPHAIAHNDQYRNQIDQYMLRHSVKPGITGWAQVNGYRGETETLEKMKKRVEYDLFYIENWSLWFDLKIIFLTFFRGFVGPSAY
ncbi:undecaprenyl-phosphate glucose phosphotransferase [Ectothiorhodospiraceae bacterium WFHF3C12]|nr:undecaprenyl-phosphate glucose phosphotransferase [Ectothiorhodospiraceae bacterium WFHF3C12]